LEKAQASRFFLTQNGELMQNTKRKMQNKKIKMKKRKPGFQNSFPFSANIIFFSKNSAKVFKDFFAEPKILFLNL
jgi:hypothetical protein